LCLGNECEEFIARRCDDELNKNVQYMKIQDEMTIAYNNQDLESFYELTMKLQPLIAKISYKTAMSDWISI
jgi:hypothetical protein